MQTTRSGTFYFILQLQLHRFVQVVFSNIYNNVVRNSKYYISTGMAVMNTLADGTEEVS